MLVTEVGMAPGACSKMGSTGPDSVMRLNLFRVWGRAFVAKARVLQSIRRARVKVGASVPSSVVSIRFAIRKYILGRSNRVDICVSVSCSANGGGLDFADHRGPVKDVARDCRFVQERMRT